MKENITNPAFFRLDTLLTLGVPQIHEFARIAVGTITSYRLILGRCLLAMREAKGFKSYGCSSEIHYAISKLGLSSAVAKECRRVAKCLIPLPHLTLAAENGRIDWSKLREITHKASPETDPLWERLARELSCREIEKLVSQTPKGGIPGDVLSEKERPVSELRCRLPEEVLQMLDRARRLFSLSQEQAVSTAQVLEHALAAYLAKHEEDDDSVEKVRRDIASDLRAQRARQVPLIAMARRMATKLGCLEDLSNKTEAKKAYQTTRAINSKTPEVHTSEEKAALDHTLAQAIGVESLEDLAEPNPIAFAPAPDETEKTPTWDVTYQTLPRIQNKRLCFNPLNRHTTKAQKREVLRREGWCCGTPGCPHKIWLHIHHLIPYSLGGRTVEEELLGLCTTCHANVHRGILQIHRRKDGSLLFTDAGGNPIKRQVDLELGRWLDLNIGWEGEEEDSFSLRAHSGRWSAFSSA